MKSAEKMAEALGPIVLEVGRSIVHNNYFQMPVGSLVHTRFVLGAHLLPNLLCQDLLTSLDADQGRVWDVCKLLQERHIAAVAQSGAAPVPITDVVVWEGELESIRRSPNNSKLQGASMGNVRLPLTEIVDELYPIRFLQMMNDTSKGTLVQSRQGAWSLALYMPVSSSLIMQTTADEARAADKETVTGFAASLWPQLSFLTMSVQKEVRL